MIRYSLILFENGDSICGIYNVFFYVIVYEFMGNVIIVVWKRKVDYSLVFNSFWFYKYL